MSYKIYYDDNLVFSGDPAEAPVDGVQIIIEYQENGRVIHQGMDYYWRVGDTWASGNIRDLECHLRKRPVELLIVLFGRWMETTKYKKMVERAMGENCDGC